MDVTVTPNRPIPAKPESLAVPADDCLGLDDVERSAPLGSEPAEEIPEGSVTQLEARAAGIALPNRDLVAEGYVLEDQGFSRANG